MPAALVQPNRQHSIAPNAGHGGLHAGPWRGAGWGGPKGHLHTVCKTGRICGDSPRPPNVQQPGKFGLERGLAGRRPCGRGGPAPLPWAGRFRGSYQRVTAWRWRLSAGPPQVAARLGKLGQPPRPPAAFYPDLFRRLRDNAHLILGAPHGRPCMTARLRLFPQFL